MLKALLLDLDETLLINPMGRFIPAYFQALTRFLAGHVPAETLIAELLAGTRAMDGNDGGGATNEEAFAAHFYPAVGVAREVLEPEFRRFYAEAFPTLRALTRPHPEARPLVEWAFAAGLQVAIATNPLFPLAAIEERLRWAGVPVSEFPYDLITAFESMHATKSHPAYYREVLERLGRVPGECLMAGDDWAWDIVPAAALGIRTFWIGEPEAVPREPGVVLDGAGPLGELRRLAVAGALTGS
ncbi:MAG: HAD family hydrolase [Acidobacteriota bacterium]